MPQKRDEMERRSQHHHKQKLSWKLPLESGAVGFWKLDEGRLDGEREGERLKPPHEGRYLRRAMVVPVSVHIPVTGLEPERAVQPGGL